MLSQSPVLDQSEKQDQKQESDWMKRMGWKLDCGFRGNHKYQVQKRNEKRMKSVGKGNKIH